MFSCFRFSLRLVPPFASALYSVPLVSPLFDKCTLVPSPRGHYAIERIIPPSFLSSQLPSVRPGDNPSHKSRQPRLLVARAHPATPLSPFLAVRARVHAARSCHLICPHRIYTLLRSVPSFSDSHRTHYECETSEDTSSPVVGPSLSTFTPSRALE